ncbi:MAG TPA: MFS transporter [Jatrophihabitantaceae bacterium]|jgi:EmrB/QacA subfamily drug resistance transporter|nr:MFS transporter [Jatrophihabitantaceae bacterium]
MPDLSRNRRLLILAICCMSLLIVGMDTTIINIALPALHSDLHASLSDLQWTVDAYTLVLASLLVLSGSTADRLGRRRTFQTGLVVFTIGSLLCSIAPGLGWLVAFRMVQAVGGSMLNPVAMSIITNVFTDRRERAFAIGVWGGVVGISLGLGPLIGGVLIDSVGWRGVFWINIPIGLAAIVLAALFVPESRAPKLRRPDALGQTLVVVALASLTYAIIEAPHRGWTSVSTLALLAASVAAAVGLERYERRRDEPLIDPRFFRSIPFSGATVTAVCAFGGFAGFLFLNTLYLQDVRGDSALVAGLCTLPLAAVTLVAAPLSGRLVGTRGPRIPLLIAGTCMAVAAIMLVRIDAGTSIGWLLASYSVYAVGFGMVNAPITNSAVSGMPNSQAGVAAAIASTSRQVGATLGVAVVGSVLNSGLGAQHVSSGFVAASSGGWWIVVGCGVAVLALGAVSTGRWARSTTDRAAHLFGDQTQLVTA